ncbi:MAG: trypsin-like peptidase domain-containing protein [Pseudomonadota bacterium]
MFLLLSFLVLVTEPVTPAPDLFAAAGRIEDAVTERPICSAALIAPDIVVTAAHCVSEAPSAPRAFRVSEDTAVSVIRFVRHPLYKEFGDSRRLRFDIAVGVLSESVDIYTSPPLALGEDAVHGEGLYIVSWPRGWERPRQRRCAVIEGTVPGVVTLGCRVRGGESGAPLLRLTEDGVELVAILNSTARQNGRSVALASDVRLRIPALLDSLRTTP